jgi:hypothetical protein
MLTCSAAVDRTARKYRNRPGPERTQVGRPRTVTCGDGRGWTCCLLYASTVRGSSPLAPLPDSRYLDPGDGPGPGGQFLQGIEHHAVRPRHCPFDSGPRVPPQGCRYSRSPPRQGRAQAHRGHDGRRHFRQEVTQRIVFGRPCLLDGFPASPRPCDDTPLTPEDQAGGAARASCHSSNRSLPCRPRLSGFALSGGCGLRHTDRRYGAGRTGVFNGHL